jgi:two-component system sensor histidine kinase KdpD
VRAAKRLATGVRGEWIAAYVETPYTTNLSQTDRDRVNQTLRLAQQLGAETITLSGQDVAEELVNYARQRNVTKIVIGKPERPRWREFLRGSLVDSLIRRSGQTDVYVIRGDAEELPPPKERPPSAGFDFKGYSLAALSVAASTGIAAGMFKMGFVQGDLSNLIMVYLVGVLFVAAFLTRKSAILASVLSVAAFDFFFVDPRFAFAVSDLHYLVTFAVMLAVAMVISTLTSRIKSQAQAARSREVRNAALLVLSRELAATREKEKICDATARRIAEVFDAQVAVLPVDGEGHLSVKASRATTYQVDEKELGVAQWVFDHDKIAGHGTATLPAAHGMYLPLIGSQGTVGVLGVCPATATAFYDPAQLRLLEAFASQAAAAMERANLAADARSAWERVEAEFMRNTLLSSVSHDLRTPLAAITGAASSLVEAETTLNGDSNWPKRSTTNPNAWNALSTTCWT